MEMSQTTCSTLSPKDLLDDVIAALRLLGGATTIRRHSTDVSWQMDVPARVAFTSCTATFRSTKARAWC